MEKSIWNEPYFDRRTWILENLESKSNHPIAKSIINNKKISLYTEEYNSFSIIIPSQKKLISKIELNILKRIQYTLS